MSFCRSLSSFLPRSGRKANPHSGVLHPLFKRGETPEIFCELFSKKDLTNHSRYDIISLFENRWCGSMAEQLFCNQQVDGPTPSTSSSDVRRRSAPDVIKPNMGAFPSGQRGQTVNLLAMPPVVRIHPLPPKQSTRPCGGCFVLMSAAALWDTACLRKSQTWRDESAARPPPPVYSLYALVAGALFW